MNKMSLIVFGETGHVLGAFTRTADPEGALTAEQVAGTGLAVRDPVSGETRATVQPQHLKVETVDRRDDVILSHSSFVLEDGVPTERATLSSGSVTYNGTEVVISGATMTEDGTAWVHIDNGQSQPVLVAVDVATSGDGTAPVTLTPGDYGVLALVPEYRAYVDTVTVT